MLSKQFTDDHILSPYSPLSFQVVNKTPKRSFSGRGGAASSVFTAELVDEEGGTIEGTFWRDSADKYYDALEVGHVYVFSRGSVKPANKKYSQVSLVTLFYHCIPFALYACLCNNGDSFNAMAYKNCNSS